MTDYEKELYDIIANISTTNAPIVFKGGLITNLVLQEHDKHSIANNMVYPYE